MTFSCDRKVGLSLPVLLLFLIIQETAIRCCSSNGMLACVLMFSKKRNLLFLSTVSLHFPDVTNGYDLKVAIEGLFTTIVIYELLFCLLKGEWHETDNNTAYCTGSLSIDRHYICCRTDIT